MKIHLSVQKLLVGDTDRQAGDLISILSFLESMIKYVILTVDQSYGNMVLAFGLDSSGSG
jgi:hypothetical protein